MQIIGYSLLAELQHILFIMKPHFSVKISSLGSSLFVLGSIFYIPL
jgi:hypothetical protein